MEYKCHEGWLMTESETDESQRVPFFVKTLHKCIYYRLKDEFDTEILNLLEGKSISANFGMSRIKCSIDDWNILIYNDGHFEATTNVAMSKMSLSATNELSYEIKLPFKTLEDGFNSLNINVKASDVMFKSLTSSFVFVNKINGMSEFVDHAVIKVVNQNGNFTGTRTSAPYTNSYIQLTVKGFISL